MLLGGIQNIDEALKHEWQGTRSRSREKISLKCVTEEDEKEANSTCGYDTDIVPNKLLAELNSDYIFGLLGGYNVLWIFEFWKESHDSNHFKMAPFLSAHDF